MPNLKYLIHDDGFYKKWIEGAPEVLEKYENIVPIMTSNTTPSGIASASTAYGNAPGYLAHRAFNEVLNDANNAWLSQGVTGADWLAYQSPSPERVTRYAIAPNMLMNGSQPKSWRFEGYNGSTWTTLDTRENITSWTAQQYNVYNITNANSYAAHRLFVLSNNGLSSYVSIAGFRIFKYIPYSPPTFSGWVNVSSTLPSKETFDQEGFDKFDFLDRKSKTLNNQSTLVNTLSNGKVYKTTIDLNKIIELKSIRVE